MPGELTITAKFAGKCVECGYRIEVGTWIKYDLVTKKARHKKCPEPDYSGTEQKNVFNTWIQRAEEVNNG